MLPQNQKPKKRFMVVGKNINKMFGFGLEQDIKKVSPWVSFVKPNVAEHYIPYEEAMIQAAPVYKQLKTPI